MASLEPALDLVGTVTSALPRWSRRTARPDDQPSLHRYRGGSGSRCERGGRASGRHTVLGVTPFASPRAWSQYECIRFRADPGSVTGLLNLVRKSFSSTYVRGANIVGGTMLVGAVGVLVLAVGRYDVPVREVLLAAPGVFAAVGAAWYNMLNSPDSMITLVNVVPTDSAGSTVASAEYRYRTTENDAVRVTPRQKHDGADPVSSSVTPWTVECESVPSDAVVSFDVTNRGY